MVIDHLSLFFILTFQLRNQQLIAITQHNSDIKGTQENLKLLGTAAEASNWNPPDWDTRLDSS